MRTPKYRITPSLLKGFQDFLDYELVAEEPWNKGPNGEYKLTPDEMGLKLETDLIDTINRAPKAPSEAADKGTAFNEIIDCLIEYRLSSREDCAIKSTRDDKGYIVIRAEINGFTFDFDPDMCREVASRFKGSVPQYLVSAVMETGYGPVELYGYIDEWTGAEMWDLKTTGKYDFGKYGNGWQHHLYPWAAIESGLTDKVDVFHYFVVEWAKGTGPLKAKNIYTESYDYDHARSAEKLRVMAERFVDWLESRREFITEPKIFGGERPDDYKGKKLTESQYNKILKEWHTN